MPNRANSDGRRERWRAHREARRRELVAAAADAVRARGAGIGMDDIAAETGVAKQVFYRYFADKADLHNAVSHAAARYVVREVTKCLAGQATPRDMLRAGVDCYLRLIQAEPELYRFVVNTTLGAGTGVAEDYQTMLGVHVTRLVGDLLRSGGLDAGAAEPWGFAIVGAVRSAADRWLASPTLTRDALAGYLSESLWHGLSAADGGAGSAVVHLRTSP